MENSMKNGGYMKKKKAFTLAEVLITLGIIGIVASMTLPAIIQKNQKTVAVTRIKKTYALLLQAFNSAQVDADPNGLTMLSYLSVVDEENDQKALTFFVENYIKSKFKIIKDYGYVTSSSAGLPNYYPLNGVIDADGNTFYGSKKYIFILSDGSIIYIGIGGDTTTARYLVAHIDINGVQKPNTIGKDVFCMVFFFPKVNSVKFFTLDKQKTRADYLRTCNKSAGTIDSRTCGALLQHDGWEMKSDYPW